MNDNVVHLEHFRTLNELEEREFKQWARDNWSTDEQDQYSEKIPSIWHPTVVRECAVMLDEHVRRWTRKVDLGNMDWNFAYFDTTIAIDSSSEELSEEEQYELAVEYFWDTKWHELTGEEISGPEDEDKLDN
jgi:hypothetical protein|tara:strand:+ start:1397 stop:1792 length:396 start_codon:yes stop_codon:yes gene_type:complete